MAKKSAFLASTLEYITKIIEAQDKIADELEVLKIELEQVGIIAEYAGVCLFENRVVGSISISLDTDIDAYVECGGQIWTETHIHGGGARPTLTRTGVGALIAGKGNRRTGALFGANVQKHKAISSSTTVHDDRTLRIIVKSEKGYMDVPGSPKDENGARTFVSQIINAAIHYKKINTMLMLR